MKIKAIILKPNRENDVRIVNPKKLDGGKTFVHGGCVYFVEPDHVRITSVRRLFLRFSYLTYYYKQGIANPIPFSELEYGESVEELVDFATKKGVIKVKMKTGKFREIVNLGVPADELRAIFTPWFYNIVAAKNRSLGEQIIFLLLVGIAGGIAYLIYRFHNPG